MDLREFGRIISGNRGPNGEFTKEARMGIAGLRVAGVTRREVAAAVGTNRLQTITDISGRIKTRGTGASAYRKGRPRKLFDRAEKRLVWLARRSPRSTYKSFKR